MDIHSFSIAYFAIEDRLLLQARGASENQNFWITRRAATMLNHAIQNLLMEIYHQSGVKKEHIAFARSFGQNHAAAEHTPYADQLHNPQSTPLLLFRVDYGVIDQNTGKVSLLDEHGKGQEFHLNTEILHAISNLLVQQSDIAEWGLPIDCQVEIVPQEKNATLH